MSSVTLPRVVSVVIGTRNRPDTLRAALASIRALEGPDLTFQILVGDNGTTPETPGVVAEFGGIYGKTEVYGCPAARNVAMAKITGEFVAFLDDDDVWLPCNIRPHIAMLDAHPEFEAVFGQVTFTDEKLRPWPEQWPVTPPADNDFFKMMMSGFFPQVGATVVRARAVQKYGLMDEKLIGDSDWDWQLRIAKDYKIGFVDQSMILFRSRPPGTADRLQWTRFGYTRRIFLRHVVRGWRRLGSPISMLRSYLGAVEVYRVYFEEAAVDRAAKGDRRGARGAIMRGFVINPFRTLGGVLKKGRVRDAFFSALPGAAQRTA